MSFEGLRYDPCSYEERLKATTYPGVYSLNTPANDCKKCDQDIPADPYIRYQTWGLTTCPPGSAIDDHSELLGLPRKASECPTKQHLPGNTPASGRCAAPSAADASPLSCRTPTEPTRLSNPPCTLRSTGINRWEWLCEDPQKRAMIPFQTNINYRMVAKDNHRACYPTPLDQSALLPVPGGADPSYQSNEIAATLNLEGPGSAMQPSWRSCTTIAQY